MTKIDKLLTSDNFKVRLGGSTGYIIEVRGRETGQAVEYELHQCGSSTSDQYYFTHKGSNYGVYWFM